MIKLPQNFSRKVMTMIIICCAILSVVAAPVFADLTTYQTNCSVNGVSETCQPPSISDFQSLVAKIISTAWSLGAVVFFVLLLYNGTIYLVGSWEESKYILGASLEDVQKRMTQWGIGFFMFFLSYPLMNTLLLALVANTDCYAALRKPGFTFFFPTLCQQVDYTQYATMVKINPPTGAQNTPYSCDLVANPPVPITAPVPQLDPFCALNCGTRYTTMTEFLYPGYTNLYVVCQCSSKTCWNTSSFP